MITRIRAARLVTWMLLISLLLAACDVQEAAQPSSATPQLVPAAPTPRTQERPRPPQRDMEAYDFELPDLAGVRVALRDFRGKRVLLNFWATWCGPCRFEIPHMVELYDELYDQEFEIVAVNLGEDVQKVVAFVRSFDMRYPVLLDHRLRVASAYYVRNIPTSIFLDERGVIRAVHVGTMTESMLRRYVDELMR